MVYHLAKWFIGLAKWFIGLAKWFINFYYMSVWFKKKLLTGSVPVNKYCSTVADILLKIMSKGCQNIGLVNFQRCPVFLKFYVSKYVSK